jgi:hypothetical protein
LEDAMVAIYQERGIKNLKKGRQKRRKIEESEISSSGSSVSR